MDVVLDVVTSAASAVTGAIRPFVFGCIELEAKLVTALGRNTFRQPDVKGFELEGG
jgi:hypothetical protein